MPFPRKTFVLRYVSVVAVFVVFSWMWLTPPQGSVVGDDIVAGVPKRSLSEMDGDSGGENKPKVAP